MVRRQSRIGGQWCPRLEHLRPHPLGDARVHLECVSVNVLERGLLRLDSLLEAVDDTHGGEHHESGGG